MTSPILVPYRGEHYMMFEDRERAPYDRDVVAWEREKGVAFTALYEGRVIGCAGILQPWSGMAYAWVSITKELAENHKIWFTRVTRNVIRTTVQVYKLNRLEALIIEGEDMNERWAKALGFTREKNGVARKFLTDGRNMVRYEWVRED